MELELKHLLPYLPYGVRFNGLRKGWAYPDVNYTLCLVDLTKDKYEYIKPILRPLSNLTINEYWKLSGKDKNKEFGFWYGKDINGEYLHFEGYTSRQIRLNRLHTLPYYAFEFLVEHHFDVFGLIEKGLAIDKNSLAEQPNIVG